MSALSAIDPTVAASYDFAIIGGGMAGASLAAELAGDARVIVLEAEEACGYHATGRSAAFWEECYGGPAITPLTRASGEFLREGGFLNERGALYVGRSQDRAAMDGFIKDFADTGVVLERKGRGFIEERAPLLRPQYTDAIWQAACADIDVAGLHQHYLKAARLAGAQIVNNAQVVSIERGSGLAANSDAAWKITTKSCAMIRARTLINAAGAWADTIAALAGARPIGIQPYRRTVLQLRTAPAADPAMPLVLDINGSFYFKPEQGRIWLSPHDEVPSAPCDAAPEELDAARAIDRFEKAAGWQIEAAERRWAGLRSFAPDRLPIYGADAHIEDFIWFAGQGGFGIQTAPAAARLLADHLLGRAPSTMTSGLDLANYSPRRFVAGEEPFEAKRAARS